MLRRDELVREGGLLRRCHTLRVQTLRQTRGVHLPEGAVHLRRAGELRELRLRDVRSAAEL